jgi:hypothetical protein
MIKKDNNFGRKVDCLIINLSSGYFRNILILAYKILIMDKN